MPPVDEETANLRTELGKLAEKIREKQEAVRDDTSLGSPGAKYTIFRMKKTIILFHQRPGKASTKKLLKGHINKVTCCHFSGDSRYSKSSLPYPLMLSLDMP